MKKAIFTCATGYTKEQIEPFVESLKKTGFEGDVYVITYDPEFNDSHVYMMSKGMRVIKRAYRGETHVATQRFIDYHEMIENEKMYERYDFVLNVDIRDVVFQADPFKWLLENESQDDIEIYASGEGITYRHEDWNGDHLETLFGRKYFMKYIDEETICSGVFIGKTKSMSILFKTIYIMMHFSGDPYSFADQLAYAISVYECFGEKAMIVDADLPWTANLGTLAAIPFNAPKWSTSDVGEYSKTEKARKHKTYKAAMIADVPQMINGQVCTPSGEPYAIVHQYDRYQPWKEELLGKDKETTIVTALYDIGREKWGDFKRPHSYYKDLMKNVLSFDSPMVVYIDEKDYDFVKEIRGNKRTEIITTPFEGLKTNVKWGDRIREVMTSEKFLQDQTVPTHPQIKHPEYNILMHEKVQFVKHAVEKNPFDTEHFMWLDAGVFHMNNRVELLNKRFPNKKSVLDENLHFIQIEDFSEEVLSDIEKFYKGHNVKIIGTSWLGHKNAILKFVDSYENLIEESLENNMMDQDQSFLTVTYLRCKDFCTLHKGVWADAINMWA